MTMSGRTWWLAFAVCALAALVPILITYRLPMADLPQHAMQVTAWKWLDHDCYRFGERYELNLLTPYLGGTMLMRVVAAVLPVSPALKLVVYLSIILLPLSLRLLTDESGLDPWIALLGFPLAFGFTFYWGFLNFAIVVPLVIVLLWTVMRSTAERTRWRAVLLLSGIIAVSHGLAYVFALLVTAPPLLLSVIRDRRSVKALAALLAPAPVLVSWVAFAASHETRARAPWDWSVGLHRLRQIFDFQLSAARELEALLFAMLIVVIGFLAGLRPSMDLRRWLPFAAVAGGFLFVPFAAFGQTLLYPRLATFVAAAAVVALIQGSPRVRPGIVHVLIVSLVLTWMAMLTARFAAFHRDARGFDEIVGAMPSNQRVLLLNVMQSEDVGGMPFLHFSGYYFTRKGGEVAWSFANNFPSLVRYVRRGTPDVPPLVTYVPELFDWRRHAAFRYIIVRAPGDMTPLIFKDADGIRLRARSGLWWLYENLSQEPRPVCSPLENGPVA